MNKTEPDRRKVSVTTLSVKWSMSLFLAGFGLFSNEFIGSDDKTDSTNKMIWKVMVLPVSWVQILGPFIWFSFLEKNLQNYGN